MQDAIWVEITMHDGRIVRGELMLATGETLYAMLRSRAVVVISEAGSRIEVPRADMRRLQLLSPGAIGSAAPRQCISGTKVEGFQSAVLGHVSAQLAELRQSVEKQLRRHDEEHWAEADDGRARTLRAIVLQIETIMAGLPKSRRRR